MNKKRKKILLIGDYVVDEHWVTGIHRSQTSSRIGQFYYRGLQSPSCSTQSFCGAGHSLSQFVTAVDENENQLLDVFGIGVWHEDDTSYLNSMIKPKGRKAITPHRLNNHESSKPINNLKLFNLSSLLYLEDKKLIGTTRIIRIYQHTGRDIELIQRIDWELEPPVILTDGFVNKENESQLTNSLLEKELDEFSQSVDGIVIHDLCKGVISKGLIEWIANKYPEAPWYISTKAWELVNTKGDNGENYSWYPTWLETLYQHDIRLFIIPIVPSKQSVTNGTIGVWVTKSNTPSYEAIKTIEKFAHKFENSKDLYIVALPEDLSMLAFNKKSNKKEKLELSSVILPKSQNAQIQIELPYGGILLPSIVFCDLFHPKLTLKGLISSALKFTIEWRAYESKRVQKPEHWNSMDTPSLNKSELMIDCKSDSLLDIDWKVENNYCISATNRYGIIARISDDGPKLCFELSRAMTDVDGYVCLTKPKKDTIRKLRSELISYKDDKNKRTKSYMLVANPGSGKTYLIQKLADELGFRYIPFNISQMLSKKDILDCFDTIITTQFKQNKNDPIIVFFDEINAQLQNEYVFDMFLSPLEEGTFIRGGKIYPIKPFVWIFVGTEEPSKILPEQNQRTIKAIDFESRLDLPPLPFKSSKDTEYLLSKTERVYLGVSLLKSFFPDVQKISEKVLKTFYELPDIEIRDLKHFVKIFKNIQRGKVVSANIPINWIEIFLEKSQFNLQEFYCWDEGNIVELQ